MTFEEAFALAKLGLIIRRSSWENDQYIVRVQYPDDYSKMTNPYLYAEELGEDGEDWREPYVMLNEDLFAEDWIVVDASGKPLSDEQESKKREPFKDMAEDNFSTLLHGVLREVSEALSSFLDEEKEK